MAWVLKIIYYVFSLECILNLYVELIFNVISNSSLVDFSRFLNGFSFYIICSVFCCKFEGSVHNLIHYLERASNQCSRGMYKRQFKSGLSL